MNAKFSAKCVALIAAGAMSMSLAACSGGSMDDSSSSNGSTANSDTITLGSVTTNSGTAAAYGEAEVAGFKLAVDEINAKGGINGKKVKLESMDDKGDATEASNADLCAGSGAIGLAFASEVPGSEVWAVEKSATTAEWTRRNLDETAKRYPAIAGNYHLDIADATQMPTLSQLDGTIDIVLTNPPYVPLADIPEQPEARDYDPDLALYGGSADGTLIPERIIARAARLLRADGLMVMEHDITQGERLAAFARTCGFVDVTVHNDYTGRPRYLTAEKQPAQ